VSPTRVTAVNRSLSQLIIDCYGVQDFQLIRPDWLDSVHFDVFAVAAKPASRATLLAMMQPVLASRFKLELHRETRVTPMYQLVVAKGGPKLTSVDTETPMHIGPAPGGGMQLTGKTRLADFASMVGAQTDRHAVDKTNLEGLFDLKLTYTYERPGADMTVGPPSIFQALELQLGLRLEPANLPMEMVIVDRAERVPVEN
jgi:uncharacterized protein (TIGR03435 family)